MEIKQVAMIGCGSMGGGIALLMAEKGLNVALNDPSRHAMDGILFQAEKEGFGDRISIHDSYDSLCEALDTTKVFMFSLPHGHVGDSVLEGLEPFLEKGDIILDLGNEHFRNTERRQGKCAVKGVRYVGVGVSGGYQAARRGPSICPGADDQSLSFVMPLLRKIAAKDDKGNPCVGPCGLGGAGHYVKMVHNGIEHGMMAAISEAWSIMISGLGMSYDEVAETLEEWYSKGELRGTLLVDIGVRICKAKDPKTGERTLPTVEDKVVEDNTGEEGTGVWSNTESVEEHIPAPTLATAHFLRLASADRAQRTRIKKTFGCAFPPQRLKSISKRCAFLEDLRQAVYASCLAAYAQGINIIVKTNRERKWHVNFDQVVQIWKAGCIIQSDYISDMLAEIMTPEASFSRKDFNLLCEPAPAADLRRCKPALQRVVVAAVASDHVVPAISASLEYIKYQTGLDLPTQFYEAELHYFGKHMYDRKDDDPAGVPTTGKFDDEGKPA